MRDSTCRARGTQGGPDPRRCGGQLEVLDTGAGGLELDSYSLAEGTPAHALRLATTEGAHTTTFRLDSSFHHESSPPVRADLVLFETGHGGAVFSVGSMAWATSLPHNGYANNVARITANVLRRFLDGRPFAPPPDGS